MSAYERVTRALERALNPHRYLTRRTTPMIFKGVRASISGAYGEVNRLLKTLNHHLQEPYPQKGIEHLQEALHKLKEAKSAFRKYEKANRVSVGKLEPQDRFRKWNGSCVYEVVFNPLTPDAHHMTDRGSRFIDEDELVRQNAVLTVKVAHDGSFSGLNWEPVDKKVLIERKVIWDDWKE
jgi:hypothetical protein